MKKVLEGTRMCAQFTHRSVANSGKSADGAGAIHKAWITAKVAEMRRTSAFARDALPLEPGSATLPGQGNARVVPYGVRSFHRNQHILVYFER